MKTLLTSALTLGLLALAPVASADDGGGDGEGRQHPNHGPKPVSEETLQSIADAWGMDVETLREERLAGKTFLQIAIENEIPREDVKAVLPPHHDKHHFRKAVAAQVAEALGLTVDELKESLKAGSSLRELVEASGLDFDALMDEIKAEIKANAPVQEQE